MVIISPSSEISSIMVTDQLLIFFELNFTIEDQEVQNPKTSTICNWFIWDCS